MKYVWTQNCATDRFDLEDERGRLIAWITRNRIDDMNQPDTVYLERDFLGYITRYFCQSSPSSKYIWRIWWWNSIDRKSETDDVEYTTQSCAKNAVIDRFLLTSKDVSTRIWEGNMTTYDD